MNRALSAISLTRAWHGVLRHPGKGVREILTTLDISLRGIMAIWFETGLIPCEFVRIFVYAGRFGPHALND